jgi:hypothetical protein
MEGEVGHKRISEILLQIKGTEFFPHTTLIIERNVGDVT